MNDEKCVFCKIVQKKISSEIIFEDDLILAFKDINPQAKIHILIIPKVHFERINKANLSEYAYLLHILLKADEIANHLGITDFQLMTNQGEQGGQIVFHQHFHLLSNQKN